MDKHKRLFELLPEGARPDFNPCKTDDLGCEHWSWSGTPDGEDGIDMELARDSIERAAMLWLMGRATEQNTAMSMTCHELNGSNYQVMFGCFWEVMGDTLIDALLAAAEHAGEGQK
jgi:hypothetical protein